MFFENVLSCHVESKVHLTISHSPPPAGGDTHVSGLEPLVTSGQQTSGLNCLRGARRIP